MAFINRLDPPGCGCTDCITGWSKPLDMASLYDKFGAAMGYVQNATGHEITIRPVVFIDGVPESHD